MTWSFDVLTRLAKETWPLRHPDWPRRWGWTEMGDDAKAEAREHAAKLLDRAFAGTRADPHGEPPPPLLHIVKVYLRNQGYEDIEPSHYGGEWTHPDWQGSDGLLEAIRDCFERQVG